MRRVILASQSPRRVTLLRDEVGLADFEVIPSEFDEYIDDHRSVQEIVKELALGKAREISEQHPDAWVIGGDTIVSFDNKQLGKPESPEDAFTMLKMLSGNKNQVSTSVALICKDLGFERAEVETADVYFTTPTDEQIWEYIHTGDPMDKAGSYGIQSPEAAFIIDRFVGDKTVVIGLPVDLTRRMLRDADVL